MRGLDHAWGHTLLWLETLDYAIVLAIGGVMSYILALSWVGQSYSILPCIVYLIHTVHISFQTFPTLIGHLIGARKEHPFFLKWGYFLNFKRYLVWGVGWDNCLWKGHQAHGGCKWHSLATLRRPHMLVTLWVGCKGGKQKLALLKYRSTSKI